jgi:hypothetical protein
MCEDNADLVLYRHLSGSSVLAAARLSNSMAKALSKTAFHEILRRNIHFLAVDCPHSVRTAVRQNCCTRPGVHVYNLQALVEATSVDELLPSLTLNRVATVFNSTLMVRRWQVSRIEVSCAMCACRFHGWTTWKMWTSS